MYNYDETLSIVNGFMDRSGMRDVYQNGEEAIGLTPNLKLDEITQE